MMEKKRFHLVNLGCAKNLVEGEHLAGMLLAADWQPAAEPEQAHLLLVNTCGFLQAAVEEAIDEILFLADDRQKWQRLAVVGCMVGRYGQKLARSLPEVDLLVGPGEVARLLEHLESPPPGRLAMSTPRTIFGAAHPRAITTGPGWAYLRLADGCRHRCSFCTIPHIRGPLRSRPPEDVLAEAAELAGQGLLELNLVAQDLTSYGLDLADRPMLTELLTEMQSIEGLRWIRCLYLHPDHVDDDVIASLGGGGKVLPYFDLPLQHVADTVLSAMGRQKSGAQLRALVRCIRESLPEAAIRCTLLTGHPGEGVEQFEKLLSWVREGWCDHLGVFPYSVEAGTRSARQVAPPAGAGEKRAAQLMAAQAKVSARRLAGLVGLEADMLLLGPHPESELLGHGRLARQAPEVDGEVIVTDGGGNPGSLVRCRITGSHQYDLEAEII